MNEQECDGHSVPVRFSKNLGVLSNVEQHRLLKASVAIVGLGCTGCHATEMLTRAGVGELVLIDGDRFEESNCNRQLYARRTTLGHFKVDCAAAAVLDVNPEARVAAHNVFLNGSNAFNLLKFVDVVVSGVDDPVAMVILHRVARKLGKPAVFVLSGCIPFEGICSTILPNGGVDYESFMGLPTKELRLEEVENARETLFKDVTLNRLRGALERGAINGDWVEQRRAGGGAPAIATISAVTATVAANECIKTILRRDGLDPVCAPDLIHYNGATCELRVRTPPEGSMWFQGDF
ncbi:MAG: ThiF family adenylyltransferase [Candidatus Eisenbacteria bacterium]